MPAPTAEQIAQEVSELKNLRDRVRRYTSFGEDNRAAIDAQIDVLENNLDEDSIYDRYDWEGNDRQLSNALDALSWLTDETEFAPSIEWRPLIRKTPADQPREDDPS